MGHFGLLFVVWILSFPSGQVTLWVDISRFERYYLVQKPPEILLLCLKNWEVNRDKYPIVH